MKIQKMIKVFVNGGGSSPYDEIAKYYGWEIGLNSGGKSKNNQPLFMIDNHFQQYNHKIHLTTIKNNRPHLASLKDIESHDNQEAIYQWALEINSYCDRLIIIPKCEINFLKILDIPNILIGLPLGKFQNLYSWHYALKYPYQIHLLGSSPLNWLRAIQRIGSEKIYSGDSNYLSNIARFGKVYKNFKSRKPFLYEVKNGRNFNYRCFDFSLNNYPSLVMKNKQLNLF